MNRPHENHPASETRPTNANQRGFFGIGVQNLSKPYNAGSLYRTAHAFHASFVFAIAPVIDVKKLMAVDTSRTSRHLPFYACENIDELPVPLDTQWVGVELRGDAEDLPNFYHPERAIYIMGPEKGSLSDDIAERCDHLIKIPTKFCVNVGIAGAIVLYDRHLKKNQKNILR